MSRVPRVSPESLVGAQKQLYELYTTGTRSAPGTDFRLVDDDGQLIGPPAAWMLNAELGLGLERLGREIRFNLGLSARHREIVILLVAEAEDSDFERYAHNKAAARAGLSAAEIAGLADGSFAAAGVAEALLVELASALIAGHELDDDLWMRAVDALGPATVFEVVTLVGYYRMMALQLRAFRLLPPV